MLSTSDEVLEIIAFALATTKISGLSSFDDRVIYTFSGSL